MILKCSRLGHPVLRQRADDVSVDDVRAGNYDDLIEDMFETMEAYRGVGLAAPQVHLPLRIFVFDSKERDDGLGNTPRSGVVFNGVYEPAEETKIVDHEGCLSVPFLGGKVPRYEKVRLRGLDGEGNPVDWLAEGFIARIFQHEVDHTDGHVYLDRMPDLRSLGYTLVL
ncbi:MAG: peptide deformylase [Thermoanaerobaculia bacterium]|jgi:peptide deformylase